MSNTCREIISLQVGHYSNFIGTHWWNIQEASFVYDNNVKTDINHDSLFQEGCTRGEPYTPRLLILDSKGALGSLPVAGNLSKPPLAGLSTSQVNWSGKVDLIHQLPEEKNEYLKSLDDENIAKCQSSTFDDPHSRKYVSGIQRVEDFNLSKSVKVWSDFLRPLLHPRTIYLLPDVLHHSEEKERSCWGFQGGVSILNKVDTSEEVFDRIRLLAESCGSLQGFHLLCDGHNGLGGIGWAVAQHLEDDYGTKDLFSFVATPPHFKATTAQELTFFITSLVQSYVELSELSTVVIPLNLRKHCWNPFAESVTFPHLLYEPDSAYQSSSVLGAFLDSITMPYRTKNQPLSMSHFAEVITPINRKVVLGSLALPVGLQETSFLVDWLIQNGDFNLSSVSGDIDASSLNIISEHRVLRGIDENRLVSPKMRLSQGLKYDLPWTVYDDFLRRNPTPSCRRIMNGIHDALKTAAPFPPIFCDMVNESGFIMEKSDRTSLCRGVKSAPVVAALSQGDRVAAFLGDLYRGVPQLDVTTAHRLVDEGLDKEVWKNTKEKLAVLLANYDAGVDQETSDESA